MKTTSPFGFISGLATTSCFLAPAIGLGLMIILGRDIKIATFLFIAFTLVVRCTGDWLFWTQMFPKEMDSSEAPKDWRSAVKDTLGTQLQAMLDMLMDVAADVWLIYMALKVAAPPVWVFFAFLGCQAIATPVQGIIADRWVKKKYRLFSMIVTAVAVVTSIKIENGATPGSYAHLFGLNHFALSVQMLIILCAKTVLSGSTIIAKATIATCIQLDILRAKKPNLSHSNWF